jgi:oxygen-independent coproporphyrinogen-3 oxidase
MTNESENVGVYIHIPFCRAKCAYCDFNAYAGMRSLYAPYTRAVAREISARSTLHALHSTTIYLGGGTPSLMPLPMLAEILAGCHASLNVSPEAEISIEANPNTVDTAYLEGLCSLGVNRLSLGLQSAHQAELDFIKRGHSFADTVKAVRLARATGFDNLSVDLIYGIPRQTMAMWQETANRTLELAPDHVSMYCLTIEERTTLALWVRRGLVPSPDDDLAADMVLWADERLTDEGLARYEISNWARPARQCRHNLIYWRNAPYLGLGAGAHSSLGGKRFWNVAHPREYIRLIEARQSAVAGSEDIERTLEMGETMMLGLRLTEGVSFASFETRFGVKMTEVYSRELGKLGEQGLLEVDETGTRLTQRGWMLGNRVFAAFLPDEPHLVGKRG